MEKRERKKCDINFIRLKRGGTVVNVRISAKGSTRRRSMLRGYSEQEYYRAKERRKDGRI
jgi:hypothetical protein